METDLNWMPAGSVPPFATSIDIVLRWGEKKRVERKISLKPEVEKRKKRWENKYRSKKGTAYRAENGKKKTDSLCEDISRAKGKQKSGRRKSSV